MCMISIDYFLIQLHSIISFFFFFNDTATTEIYTLSLHDALPISAGQVLQRIEVDARVGALTGLQPSPGGQVGHAVAQHDDVQDRKSTRLNSSHLVISYAVFCLKKKKKKADSPYVVRHLRTDSIST